MNVSYRLGWVVVVASLVLGCGKIEMQYVLSDRANETMDENAQQQLADSLDQVFGTPEAPHVSESVAQFLKTSDQRLKNGAESYRLLCMHCHGLTGDGRGPTAGPKERPWLEPKPRDYRLGAFKFTSTPKEIQKPTRADLLRTVRNGIAGTSMPAFALYHDDEPQRIENVVDYVILLSIRGQTERFVVDDYQPGDQVTPQSVAQNADSVTAQWLETDQKIDNPSVPRPAADVASLVRGKELFLNQKYQCLACHGEEGRGDGLEKGLGTPDIKNIDDWGEPLKPANLTLGVYRGGGRPLDIFRRIHAGIKGGRMPAQAGNLTDDQIWDLVNYVRSIPYEEDGPTVAQSEAAGHESKKQD